MKIATGLLSIFLSLIVLLQSCAVVTTARLGGDEAVFNAASTGVFAGFLFFVAGAFAFALPLVSAIMLSVAGLLAMMAATDFEDMGIWAFVAFVLAAMAFGAWHLARKAAAKTAATAATKGSDV